MDTTKPDGTGDLPRPALKATTKPVAPTAQAGGGRLVDDRRAEARMAQKAVVVMAFGPGLYDGFENAIVIDCSRRGVGLVLNHYLPPGAHLFLKLKLKTTSLAVYEVKHCERCPDGFQVGAEFRNVVGNEDVSDVTADRVRDALLKLPPATQKA